MLKNSKRLCVFAHFNPQFRVAEYVFYYLFQSAVELL